MTTRHSPRHSVRYSSAPRALLFSSIVLAASSCSTIKNADFSGADLTSVSFTRKQVDPTLEIRGSAGSELGVGTEYGVVFLGRSAVSGEVDVTAWYGDGPSIEAALVESLGGGVYLAATEIRVPNVPLDFGELAPGTEVLVRGRRGPRVWTATGEVRQHPQVEGLLLSVSGDFDASEDQLGAGVFLRGPDGQADEGLRLVGLISGGLEIDVDGQSRRFLTALGARELWRLAAWHRDLSHERRWVYREDIL
jgi:hypothetical protein